VPEYSLVPISDEQAKLGQEALKVLRGLGSFLEKVLGSVPEDLIGYLGGDWLRVRRAENLANLMHRAKARLETWGVEAPIPPSLSVTLPLFRDAADESREELQELWARLLAAAMDPSRADRVRARFFDALQKLDPLDARVLACLHGRGGGAYESQRNEMAGELGISRDEVEVSLANLRRVELAFEPEGNLIAITALGREFLRAVAD
jgi:Abortive infection alpha